MWPILRVTPTPGFPWRVPVIPYPGVLPGLTCVTLKSFPVQKVNYMFTFIAYCWPQLLQFS